MGLPPVVNREPEQYIYEDPGLSLPCKPFDRCLHSLTDSLCTLSVSCILMFHIWDQNYHIDKNARENKLGQVFIKTNRFPLHFAYCRQSQIVDLFDVSARISVQNHNLRPLCDNVKTVEESVHEHP